jgi:anti-sigma B factor antagonist
VEIATRQAGNATVVDIVGDIDLYNSPEVRKVLLDELRNKRTARLIINLTKVRYIDSSGVASLIEALKLSREAKARLILFGLSRAAREVLELSRLIKVFEVYQSEEEALRAAG